MAVTVNSQSVTLNAVAGGDDVIILNPGAGKRVRGTGFKLTHSNGGLIRLHWGDLSGGDFVWEESIGVPPDCAGLTGVDIEGAIGAILKISSPAGTLNGTAFVYAANR